MFNGVLDYSNLAEWENKMRDVPIEALKAEASKRGYYLAKKAPRLTLLPCTCGCNRRDTLRDYDGHKLTYICCSCGKQVHAYTPLELKEKWNAEVSNGEK